MLVFGCCFPITWQSWNAEFLDVTSIYRNCPNVNKTMKGQVMTVVLCPGFAGWLGQVGSEAETKGEKRMGKDRSARTDREVQRAS